jgi:hypothetical protein
MQKLQVRLLSITERVGMTLTWKQGKKLVEDAAPLRYRGSALTVLQRFVGKAYSPTKDDVQQPFTRSLSSIRKGVNVKERQFYNLLEELHDVVSYERHGKKITYTLNLESLSGLDPEAVLKAEEKRNRERRTAQARQKRAANRPIRIAKEYFATQDILTLTEGAGI